MKLKIGMTLQMASLLASFLNRIGKNFTTNWYDIRDLQEWMLAEIYRKKKSYPIWKKKVLFSWVSYQKMQDSEHINSARFYYKKFNELFRYFFRIMFPFDYNRLKLLGIEGDIAQDCDTFFDYEYELNLNEIEDFVNFKNEFGSPEDYSRIISYSFNFIVTTFGKMLTEILKNKSQIVMLCANFSKRSDLKYNIRFVIVARPLEYRILKSYLDTMIFHFGEKLPSISPEFLNALHKKSDVIYKFAMTEFNNTQFRILPVFFTLQKKAQTLEACTPILDILNFICSRVEDSIYDTKNLVEEIIQTKYTNNQNYASELASIFDFVNNYASLYSTFQSNNRANIENQFQLFFFYSQYFFGGNLNASQKNPALFFPELMIKELQNENMQDTAAQHKFTIFSQFLFQGLIQLGNPSFDFAFRKIFDCSIFELNENFFECFLYSLNKRFHAILEEKHNDFPDLCFDFNEIIHLLIIILVNLVNRVFLAETPIQAMQNFRDQLGRYNPEGLSLRVLELRIFKDIPFSDNNWQDYFISRNKQYVKNLFKEQIEIPDSYFFTSERLLKINMIYDRVLLETTPYLEEWLIRQILKKFFAFCDEIEKNLGPNYDENDLHQVISGYFTKTTLDPVIRDHLDDFADFLSNIWMTINGEKELNPN